MVFTLQIKWYIKYHFDFTALNVKMCYVHHNAAISILDKGRMQITRNIEKQRL